MNRFYTLLSMILLLSLSLSAETTVTQNLDDSDYWKNDTGYNEFPTSSSDMDKELTDYVSVLGNVYRIKYCYMPGKYTLMYKGKGQIVLPKVNGNVTSVSFKTSSSTSESAKIALYVDEEMIEETSISKSTTISFSNLNVSSIDHEISIRNTTSSKNAQLTELSFTYNESLNNNPLITVTAADDASEVNEDGSFHGTMHVTITPDASATGTTYYTINGGGQIEYIAPFTVTEDAEIVAWSTDSEGVESEKTIKKLTQMKVAAPTFTPEACSFYDVNYVVSLATETLGATIQYSFDAIEWNDYPVGGIVITGTRTIYARASLEGYKDSDVVLATYTYIEPGSQKKYKLVTSKDELIIGDKYLIVSSKDNGSAYAMSSVQKSNNRDGVAVEVSDNIIMLDVTSIVGIFELCEGMISTSYAFYDSTNMGYLCAASSSSNYLRTQDTLSNDASCAITVEAEADVTIGFLGDYTKNQMRWNEQSVLFSCYSSGQKDIYLYKEITDDVVSLSAPVISVTEGSVDSDNRFSKSITVAITCTTPDADLEYRLSETDEWIVYTQPIKIEQTTTIYARSLLAELIRESTAIYTYFKTEVESIDEFKKMGPLDTSTVSSSNSLSYKGASFTFTCPLYVVEQEGERLFVTDKKDNFHNCMTILLKGNSGNSKTFAKGEEIPAGVKGYYVCYNDIVPELYINSFSATAEGHSSDEGCYLPEQSGTVVTLSPEIESVEKILAARTDTPDYSYMSKYVNIAYAWYTYNSIDSNAIIGYLSVPVDDSMEYEANAPMRVLGAGELTIPVYNLFGLSTQIPTESGLVSVAGVLDYSSTNGVGARFDPISFGVATGVENVNAPKDAIRVIGGNIVAPHGVKIYNLNGVAVGTDDLQPGIYIVRYADIALKVVIR